MAAAAGEQAPTEFTRGQPGDADTRGATLVELHNERMQTERENAALEKVRARRCCRPCFARLTLSFHSVLAPPRIK